MKTTDYPVPDSIAAHPAWFRLEDQSDYYNRKATSYQQIYKRIKLGLIVLAAAIPVMAFLPADMPGQQFLIAGAGAVMAVLEAVLLLNRFSDLWIRYRGTAESLKRERWLLLSRAADYKGLDDGQALLLLAERIEVLLALEHSEWTEEQQQALARMAAAQHKEEPPANP
ncbi:MAG: hypothetical protein RLY71_3823 [Pseudomonadota bacterium]|jgi:hypothetical protein